MLELSETEITMFPKEKMENLKRSLGDFPGGPLGKTPHSQCRGPRFDPWSGN